MSELHLTVLQRLDDLEIKLNTVLDRLASQESSDWVDRKSACSLLGISDRHLTQLMQKGVIHGDALRNVGTPKKPRYRFHRSRALSQFLARVEAEPPRRAAGARA